MAERRASLVARVTLVTTAVALLAVLLTGAVALGLVRGAAESLARTTLGRQADLLALTLDRADPASGAGAGESSTVRRALRLSQALAAQGIDVTLDRAGSPSPVLTAEDRAALAAGRPVSAVRDGAAGRQLVEARPTEAGPSVVLAQPATAASAESATEARRRLVLPLVAGLLGAALAGWLLARWVSRPIEDAARGARQLAGGARDIRLEETGPAEVVEVASALNALSSALADSETRERRFLVSVSHDLRTPLTAVRGYAEALSDGVVPADEVRRTGEVMLGEATRLDRMVTDLLDLARLGAHDLRVDVEPVDLVRVVTDAAAVWAARCAAVGVELRVETDAGSVVVRTDAGRVRQALDGLAENALRVTPAGQPVVLAVRREGPDAVLEVRDGGPGLTEDDLAVAFERGALHARYAGIRPVGTGIGLALVAALAQRLGGSVGAGTAPEGGACFTLRLPAEEGQPPSAAVIGGVRS